MGFSLVGTGTFIKSTINGSSTTLTFSTGAAAAGDIVVACMVHTRGAITSNLTSSAGTAYTELEALANGNLGIEYGYRILTSSETTVTSCATGSAQDSVVLSAIVLRGAASPAITVDLSTTGTSSNPNSPAVQVSGQNNAVITAYAILANTPSLTAPSGFLNIVSSGATDTRSCAGGLAWKSTNDGVTDPSSWTGAAASGVAWIATTITIRSTDPPTYRQLMDFTNPPSIKEGMIGY